MSKIKVSEASGVVLDYMEAKARGFNIYHSTMLNGHIMHGFWVSGYYPGDLNSWVPLSKIAASTDWAQGGPIIERERLCIDIGHDGVWLACSKQNYDDVPEFMHAAPTPLIAAMRCYVASKLGEEVEVPKELL
jgi:hypothetical protein